MRASVKFLSPSPLYSDSPNSSNLNNQYTQQSLSQSRLSINPRPISGGLMKKVGFFLAALFCTLLMSVTAWGQANPTPQPVPYSQDFSGLAHTSTAYPAGWQGWTIAASTGSTFNTGGPIADQALQPSGNISSTSAGVYNFNGKIGYLNGTGLDLTVALAINTTGKSSVNVSYDVMTIRNPYNGSNSTRINEVTLQYRVGTSGMWTTLTGIEYQNNTTSQIGSTLTTPQNPQTKSITLPAACNNQPIVQLRWPSREVSGGGTRPSFAFDNIIITGTAIPPTVTTNGATNITTNSATLNGTVNANGNSTTVTFQYGTDTSYGTTVAGTPSPVTDNIDTSVSANITGLLPNTTYHYRVVGTSAGGTVTGGDQSFTTNPATISGQVTRNGVGLPGVNLTLSGSATNTTMTDASGNYSFTGLSNGNYTVTPNFAGFSFSPASQSFTNLTTNQTANFTATPLVIISEFRLQGPSSTSDEFIALYNTSGSPVSIAGFIVTDSNGVISVVTSGSIPGYGHYLITNSDGYSLANYGGVGAAAGDQTYPGVDVASDAGLHLDNGAGAILDAVGFTTSPAAYREGNGLTPVSAPGEYTFARKFATTGLPQDTNVNANDFWFLAVDPASISGVTAVLGAPGPENLASPINRTPTMRSSLIDSSGSLGGANAARDTNSYTYNRPGGGTISFPAGTLDLRRQITNTTGGNVTRIRIRINSLTTLNSPGYTLGGAQADVRGINSPTVTITIGNSSVTAQAITLEEDPPSQPQGGGYNASWLVPLDPQAFPAGLPNNQSVIVNIRFGVKQGGSFKFSYTVEVLP